MGEGKHAQGRSVDSRFDSLFLGRIMVLFPFSFFGGKNMVQRISRRLTCMEKGVPRSLYSVYVGGKRRMMWRFAGGKDETRATFEGSFRRVFAEESHQQV